MVHRPKYIIPVFRIRAMLVRSNVCLKCNLEVSFKNLTVVDKREWAWLLFSLQGIEDASEIRELSKYKPHVLLTQENTQIKELQQENKGTKRSVLLEGEECVVLLLWHFSLIGFAELWLSLEEHQYALELIMGRYRKQMLTLMMAKKELDTKPVLSLHEDHAKVCLMFHFF